MTAQPVAHDDPLDPERIAADLPESEREPFLAEYRRLLTQAIDPGGWPELTRYLRLMRAHADMAAEPEYWEARERARSGAGNWVSLEDCIRERRGA